MRTIRPGSAADRQEKVVNLRDCGPEGCDLDWLSSERHEAEIDDVMAFTRFSLLRGWGDGLPLIPPTEARVRAFLSRNNRYPDEVICSLPPSNAECTVEKIAINAVMAGAEPESLPLIIAALEAMADPDFELFGQNTTTAPVVPLTLVNGSIRDRLQIPYQHGCLGGAATAALAIGRTIRLVMRNIAGQVVNVTSQSTFGSPGHTHTHTHTYTHTQKKALLKGFRSAFIASKKPSPPPSFPCSSRFSFSFLAIFLLFSLSFTCLLLFCGSVTFGLLIVLLILLLPSVILSSWAPRMPRG